MKKGFTLVELLAVIIIIGVVALIAVPSVMKSIEKSREKSYNIQVQNIELAAKKWATDNIDELDSEYLNSSYVPINMLRDLEYLPKDKIKNPNTNEEMLGCIEVSYDSDSKTYTYQYDDENINCATRNEKGYYYQKNADDEEWKIDITNKKESIYSYLLGPDNSNVVVSGSGLYDMEDRYVFRGNDVNNYVLLNGANYRILSLDKNTKSLKLIAEDKSSAQWDSSNENEDISFNASTLYEGINEEEKNKKYESILNNNVKWNVGKIENTDNLNLDAIKAYEAKTKIVSKVGLISMSEYMEASINSDCANGVFSSCALDTYLSMKDSWTTTTTLNSVVYIDSNGVLSYETDLENAVHNIYPVINVVTTEKNGEGSSLNRFIINSTES